MKNTLSLYSKKFKKMNVRKTLTLGVLLTLAASANCAWAEHYTEDKVFDKRPIIGGDNDFISCDGKLTFNQGVVLNNGVIQSQSNVIKGEVINKTANNASFIMGLNNTIEYDYNYATGPNMITNQYDGYLYVEAAKGGTNLFDGHAVTHTHGDIGNGHVSIEQTGAILNAGGTIEVIGGNNIFRDTNILNAGYLDISAEHNNSIGGTDTLAGITNANLGSFEIVAGETNTVVGGYTGIMSQTVPQSLVDYIYAHDSELVDKIYDYHHGKLSKEQISNALHMIKSTFGDKEKILKAKNNNIKGGVDGILTLLGDNKLLGINNTVIGGSTGITMTPLSIDLMVELASGVVPEQYSQTKLISLGGKNLVVGNENGIFAGNMYFTANGAGHLMQPFASQHTVELMNTGGDNIVLSQDKGINVGDSRYAFAKYLGYTHPQNSLDKFYQAIIAQAAKHDPDVKITNLQEAYEYFIDAESKAGFLIDSLPGGKVVMATETGTNIVKGKNEAISAMSKGIVTLNGTDNVITTDISQEVANGAITENSLIIDTNDKYAVHALSGATVSVTAKGGKNYIESNGGKTVSANGGYLAKDDITGSSKKDVSSHITINGATQIVNTKWNTKESTADKGDDIALMATAKNNKVSNFTSFAEIPQNDLGGIVDLDFQGTGTENLIQGKIVAGTSGMINVKNGSAVINGDVLAANGGAIKLELGENSQLNGCVDNYQVENWQNKTNASKFVEDVQGAGAVNISMGAGSVWNAQGQSFVDSFKGQGSVNMHDAAFSGGAVHIGELKGEHTFNLDLHKDGSGDMIYIQNGTAEKQNLQIANKKEFLESVKAGEEVRFATIGNAGGGFGNKTQIKNAGVFNVDFDIVYKDYASDANNNQEYNDAYNGNALGENKPGSQYVEDIYGTGKKVQNVYVVKTGNDAGEGNGGTGDNNNNNHNNNNGELSDGGKTVVDMSKVNYNNAVYMDRLNKRLGEARYLDGDAGLWLRMRHDKIGKDNDFRIQNTMYEVGYDKKQAAKDGVRHIGVALDYMDGQSEYTGVGGNGEISRKGVWLYDTWLGDKGHYSDFVAKWGRLDNDFALYRDGEKISGDFNNNVYSLSAEYGMKQDIGHAWYFEPQVQMQYARIGDAAYTTSQGTAVDLAAVNSLLGRAGFRIGRNVAQHSNIYFKADIIHEFLGDQDIEARDITGTLAQTYTNDGTWCDVGVGFATALSPNSYAYLDLEQTLGNGYEDTYQVNLGLQWNF